MTPRVQAAMVLGLLALARGNPAEAEAYSREAAQRAGPCGALPVLRGRRLARSRLARGDAAAKELVAQRDADGHQQPDRT